MLDKIKTLTPAIFLILTTVCIYTPHLIYFENQSDFSTSFSDLVPTLLTFTLFGLLLSSLIFLLPKIIVKYISSLLLVVSLLIWLQASFFALSYGVLDGSIIDFKLFNNRGYKEFIVICLAILFSIVFRNKINTHFPFIIYLIVFSQILMVGYNTIVEEKDKETLVEIDDEFFNYSTEKNIIVVVLDTFGSEYFQQIIENNPNIVENFNGFVSYTDAISNYPATKASLPSFLTGKMLKENQSYSSFLNDSGKHGFLKKFESRGYKVSAVGMASRFKHIYPKRYIFLPSSDPSEVYNQTARTLLDLSLFRSAPHFQKKYIYQNDQWLFSNNKNTKDVPTVNPEMALYMFDMVTNRAQIADSLPRSKFIHLRLPHPSFVLDAECNRNNNKNNSRSNAPLQQSTCALNKLVNYLNKLKEIGAYNNSLIVVTSDHGARVFDSFEPTGFPSYNELKTSGIMFMIKGVNQNKEFTQVSQPLSLKIIHDVLLDESIHESELNSLEDLNRFFYSYQNSFNKVSDRVHAGSLYKVLPNYLNPLSWQFLEFHTHKCPNKKTPLKISFTERHREEYCAKFNFLQPEDDGSGAWTEGIDARIILKLTTDDYQDFESITFETKFSPSSLLLEEPNRIQWFINDQLLHEQEISKDKIQTSLFKVPISLLKSKPKTEVKIYLPDTIFPNPSNSVQKGVFIRQMKIF